MHEVLEDIWFKSTLTTNKQTQLWCDRMHFHTNATISSFLFKFYPFEKRFLVPPLQFWRNSPNTPTLIHTAHQTPITNSEQALLMQVKMVGIAVGSPQTKWQLLHKAWVNHITDFITFHPPRRN